jgi:DNA invertase Pin-like site-specific DNA recombinase
VGCYYTWSEIAASRNESDLVLFWSLERFSREGVLETIQHLEGLSSYGVEWFSFREEYLRSVGVFKEAVLAILAAIAKQERIRLSERVLAGLSRAKAQGKVLGRPRAAVRPERVTRLRERGLSIRQIAADTGVSAMTVQRILARADQRSTSRLSIFRLM